MYRCSSNVAVRAVRDTAEAASWSEILELMQDEGAGFPEIRHPFSGVPIRSASYSIFGSMLELSLLFMESTTVANKVRIEFKWLAQWGMQHSS